MSNGTFSAESVRLPVGGGTAIPTSRHEADSRPFTASVPAGKHPVALTFPPLRPRYTQDGPAAPFAWVPPKPASCPAAAAAPKLHRLPLSGGSHPSPSPTPAPCVCANAHRERGRCSPFTPI